MDYNKIAIPVTHNISDYNILYQTEFKYTLYTIAKLEIWRSHTPCPCSSPAMLASNRLPCIGRRGLILQNLDIPEKGQGFSAPKTKRSPKSYYLFIFRDVTSKQNLMHKLVDLRSPDCNLLVLVLW